MTAKLHATAGGCALALIAGFWGATAISELSGDPEAVRAVKRGILWGMAVLIPCLMATAFSGSRLARGASAPLIVRKRRRMRIVALNGFLLLPSALFLAFKAEAGAFDTAFIVVQAIELLAGGLNMSLMALNLRDGLALRVRAPLSV